MAPTTSSFLRDLIARWNAGHPAEKVTLVPLDENSDGQHVQLVKNAKDQSDALDVVIIDNVWTTEFAVNHYLDELPQDQFPMAEFLPSVLAASQYQGALYTVPTIADGGLLYYRSDLLKAAGIEKPPVTWSEMIADCKAVAALPSGAGVDCYAGQLDRYEGLTVNFAEAVESAGGHITDDAGRPTVDSPQAKAGLDFLVEGIRSGYIPRSALAYDEEKGRQAFQAGRLVFQRQWPYQYASLANTDGSSAVAGKFAVAPLPGLSGAGVSILGGHAAGVSAFSKKKKTALDFIKFYTTKQNSLTNLTLDSKAPVYASIYDDPAMRQKFPFLAVLKESIASAATRPKVVDYSDATLAIQGAVHDALTGRSNSAETLTDLQKKLAALSAG